MTGVVISLPTAAKRKVKQNRNQAARAAKAGLPKLEVEYVYPTIREAMRTAATLIKLGPSPERELLTALCFALDDDARARVEAFLALGVAAQRESAIDARAIFKASRPNVGEKYDLEIALRLLLERAENQL
ncbi:hypothetical protein [Sphingomonas sp. BK235]|uniref:hypothetical protein n=1 Tax=Sphingomonas sp. BK235 TaxID=2512131 RepID=UPI001042B0FC|nr:hypothetical protein [Sphingomonas sp. BK235]TCP36529.1 hypothetical protein EV292_10125 [Sphingomonas sp. BK235]